jgi:hypothetical protein
MHEAFVLIVVNAVRERYVSEKAFYTEELGISGQSWTRWKNGERGLKAENLQKIARLFTDYEWMLANKVARNADVLPEVASDPVAEYLRLKVAIASRWIRQENVRVDWKTAAVSKGKFKENVTILRVATTYGHWSYQDIIEIRVVGITHKQIGTKKQALLEWMHDEKAQQKYLEYSKNAFVPESTLEE